MKLKPETKHMDRSHLTEKEKRHSIALVATAGLILLIGTVAGFDWGVFTTKAYLFPLGFFVLCSYIAAFGVICFVWGYIGAMEDERVNGPS